MFETVVIELHETKEQIERDEKIERKKKHGGY